MTAIEVLKYMLDKAESEVPESDRIIGLNVPVDIVREIIDAQPERKTGRWIPCSERLPEESGTYIVTAYDGATKRVTYAKYQKRLKRWELTGARAYWRVLAWMPLPEPYRDGGEADEHTD